MFQSAGVVTHKSTHAYRGTGACHAQDQGAQIAEIEQHANWRYHTLSEQDSERGCLQDGRLFSSQRATMAHT